MTETGGVGAQLVGTREAARRRFLRQAHHTVALICTRVVNTRRVLAFLAGTTPRGGPTLPLGSLSDDAAWLNGDSTANGRERAGSRVCIAPRTSRAVRIFGGDFISRSTRCIQVPSRPLWECPRLERLSSL